MNVQPIVRYMLLAEDFVIDPVDHRQVTIVNLRATYRVLDEYPALVEEICCVFAVTDGRGDGSIQIACVDEETERPVFLVIFMRSTSAMTPWS